VPPDEHLFQQRGISTDDHVHLVAVADELVDGPTPAALAPRISTRVVTSRILAMRPHPTASQPRNEGAGRVATPHDGDSTENGERYWMNQ
jgi:hypothetical protein